ncbi:hypothetical protein FKO01_38555 [Mesorhizobium sp. B2-3-3]|nr:hypothetical protein FKO01_38555 [Mesorhizobium sp. B2-3-3]
MTPRSWRATASNTTRSAEWRREARYGQARNGSRDERAQRDRRSSPDDPIRFTGWHSCTDPFATLDPPRDS